MVDALTRTDKSINHAPLSERNIRQSDIREIRFLNSDSLEVIGARAFAGWNLQEITIPDGVTRIDDEAFADCNHLKIVRLSKNVMTIGENAFAYCDNLRKIIVADDSGASVKQNAVVAVKKSGLPDSQVQVLTESENRASLLAGIMMDAFLVACMGMVIYWVYSMQGNGECNSCDSIPSAPNNRM